jgi:hypothetical protein
LPMLVVEECGRPWYKDACDLPLPRRLYS